MQCIPNEQQPTLHHQRIVAMMRAGADDYLFKGHLARLPEAVGREIGSARRLQRSESQAEAILDGIDDGVVTTAADGIITFFSAGAERMFGYLASEVVGTHVGRLIPEHMGRPGKLLGLRANGQEFPMEASISRVEIGGEVLVTVLVRDTSERLRAAHDLRVSEERFATYFRSNPVPSIIGRVSDRSVVAINDAAIALLGYSLDELAGRDVYAMGLIVDPARVRAAIDATSGEASSVEIEVRTKAGDVKPVMLYLRPIVVDGEPSRVISFVDLAERDRLAALELSTRALDEGMRAKAAFVASMTHELRTPLNAILGFSKLLLEQLDLGTKHRRYLEHVYDAGTHLLRLINDVLEIARLDAGKIELRREAVGAASLLEPVVVAARLAASAKGLTFTTTVPDRVILWVDATRIREILHNLLSNAVKFTPRGGEVALRALIDGDALVLDVADNGVGIPPRLHHRVFARFERLHEGVVAEGGTGLGLALTKQLVEVHGGTIAFTSALGAGSTFHVRLPKSLAPAAMAGGAAAPLTPPDLAVPSRATAGRSVPIRILVVEDQAMMADLLSENLARQVDVVVVGTADTAEDALRMAQALQPAVIVMDYSLPDGTGAQAAAEIRALGLPCAVIVFSSASERDAVQHSLLAGAVAYVPKSDPVDLLVDTIRRAAAGELVLPAMMLRELAIYADRQWAEARPALGANEERTIELARDGLSPAAISARLGLDARQVRDEWRSAMEKLSRSSEGRPAGSAV